jgi:siroheme synthase (precorrin-2 oxidase/ferrochelatase)
MKKKEETDLNKEDLEKVKYFNKRNKEKVKKFLEDAKKRRQTQA